MTVDEFVKMITNSRQNNCLYHFTDLSNIPSINAYGLLSKKSLREKGWWPPLATGGNRLSHDLDTFRGIDPYISLCMTRNHAMKFIAQRDGRLPNPIYLAINPEILKVDGVKIALGVANSNDVEILSVNDAIDRIDYEVLYKWTNWSDPQIQQRMYATNKLEVLVPDEIPPTMILGII